MNSYYEFSVVSYLIAKSSAETLYSKKETDWERERERKQCFRAARSSNETTRFVKYKTEYFIRLEIPYSWDTPHCLAWRASPPHSYVLIKPSLQQQLHLFRLSIRHSTNITQNILIYSCYHLHFVYYVYESNDALIGKSVLIQII